MRESSYIMDELKSAREQQKRRDDVLMVPFR